MPLSDTETVRDRASGHAERYRWPGMQAAGEHSRRTTPPRPARSGLVLLAGLAVTFAAIATTTAAAFLAGTAVAGVGVGLALLGVNRTLIALAAPGQRAGSSPPSSSSPSSGSASRS